jgi:2-dehydro-3-deoxygluconokinase
MFPWSTILAGASWFHVTGITPALGPDVAAATREAVDAAKAAGARVSIDLNYRKKLWSETEARKTMRVLAAQADVIIANEEDIQACLGLEVSGTDVVAGTLDVSAYRATAERVSKEFGASYVAITLRESHSASRNGWSAVLFDAAAAAFHHSQHYDITVVDRIGGGDSFAAGLIFGLVTGRTPEASLRFAVAASALKHTIPGDFNRVGVADVDRLAGGDGSGRVQR